MRVLAISKPPTDPEFQHLTLELGSISGVWPRALTTPRSGAEQRFASRTKFRHGFGRDKSGSRSHPEEFMW